MQDTKHQLLRSVEEYHSFLEKLFNDEVITLEQLFDLEIEDVNPDNDELFEGFRIVAETYQPKEYPAIAVYNYSSDWDRMGSFKIEFLEFIVLAEFGTQSTVSDLEAKLFEKERYINFLENKIASY